MIDNTSLLKARIKMLKNKKQTLPLEKKKKNLTSQKASTPIFRLYSNQATEILHNVTELRNLVLDKRKEYILCSGSLKSSYGNYSAMSEFDRKHFDTDSDTAVKQCSKLVHYFETKINSDTSLRRNDEFLHLKMVAQLLNIYLKDICRLIAQLKTIYLKKTEYIRKICRLANLVDMYEASIVETSNTNKKLDKENERRQQILSTKKQKSTDNNELKNRQLLFLQAKIKKKKVFDFTENGKDRDKLFSSKLNMEQGWSDLDNELIFSDRKYEVSNFSNDELTHNNNNEWINAEKTKLLNNESIVKHATDNKSQSSIFKIKKTRKTENNILHIDNPLEAEYQHTELSRIEQEQLMAENKKLFNKCARTNEAILEIGSQLSEIQRLQDTFAEKITEQERDIDSIHTQTIYTLDNIESANQFIREAISNTASRRVIAIFCLIVLTFTLLFLDWYNP